MCIRDRTNSCLPETSTLSCLSRTVLGKLGPGQPGPGQLGPGQLGPGCEKGLNWTKISTTFLSNKYLFKYLSQPIRIITMILCCNNISLIFLQRIYVVHNISPTNTCCTCNSAIYIVTITTPSFSYTRIDWFWDSAIIFIAAIITR